MKKICIVLMLVFVSQLFFGSDGGFTEVVIHGFKFASGDYRTSLDSKAQGYLYTKAHLPNQIVLGHSQGGLTGLGYIAKEKQLNGDNSNVKAFISVNSPVRGFAGLDYGYELMRHNLLNAQSIHTRGWISTVGHGIPLFNIILCLLPPEFYGNIFLFIIDCYNGALAAIDYIAGELDFLPKKANVSLYRTILNTPYPNDSVREITDMGRFSEYLKTYVGPTVVKIVQLPPLIPGGSPLFYFVFEQQHTNYRSDVPIGHVVGMSANPIDLEKNNDTRNMSKVLIELSEYLYGTGQIINTALAITTFPLGTLYYSDRAQKCEEAKNWSKNYVSRIGDLVGGRTNDGFISVETQTLKGVNPDWKKLVGVDHVDSTPPSEPKRLRGEMGLQTALIWGKDGAVNMIIKEMRLD